MEWISWLYIYIYIYIYIYCLIDIKHTLHALTIGICKNKTMVYTTEIQHKYQAKLNFQLVNSKPAPSCDVDLVTLRMANILCKSYEYDPSAQTITVYSHLFVAQQCFCPAKFWLVSTKETVKTVLPLNILNCKSMLASVYLLMLPAPFQ